MKLRVTVALLACVALSSLTAHAQMSEGEKKAAARAAYVEGVDLQDKGKPTEALARFEAAQKLFDAHTHLLHIAECQALTGKLVEASETYETLIRKPLGEKPPEAFVQAQEQGKAELTVLRQRIPTMRVTVTPEPPSLQNLQINMNDKQVPTELVGIARPVNPGAYKLTATATGWGTAQPVEVELKERETKDVALTLKQGATGAVAAAPSALTGGQTPPPPYDQPTTKPKESPSSTGLLIGLRPALFVPVGEVTKNVKFKEYAAAGPGVGLDLIGRVARMFLVGGTLEFASLGAPDARSFPLGTKAEVSTQTVYLGILAGIMPNVDRVTFVADAGAGLRILSRDAKFTTTAGTSSADETYNGLELALNAGVSIPAGPLRIVPKAGLAFGQFTNRDCGIGTSGATLSGCTSNADITTASHAMLNLAVGVYYHADFARKSGATGGTTATAN